MAPLIMPKNTSARLLYGSTIESSHVVTINIPGLTKKLEKSTFTPT